MKKTLTKNHACIDYIFCINNKHSMFIPGEYFNEQPVFKLLLKIDNFKNFDNVIQKIKNIDDQYVVLSPFNEQLTMKEMIDNYSSNLQLITSVLLVIVIVLISIYKIYLASTKKYQICILKANGLTRSQIVKMSLIDLLIEQLQTIILVLIFSAIINLLIKDYFNYSISVLNPMFILFIIVFCFGVHVIPTIITVAYFNQYSPETLLRN